MLISTKGKEKDSSNKLHSVTHSDCVICSNKRCQQSTDHTYFPFYQFKNLVLRSRQQNKKIQQIKLNVTQFYKKLCRSMKEMLQSQCLKACQSINKYYFNYLTDLKASDLQILCEVIQNNTKSVPSRRVIKLAKFLVDQRTSKPADIKCTDQFSEIFKKIDDKIKNFNISNISKVLKKQIINIDDIIDKYQTSTTSTLRSLKQSRCPIPQQSSRQEQVFEWKNLKIRNNIKNVVLNCKKITDPQFLLNLPKVQKFSNIIELDAHENFLTHLSCVAINNYLPQLISLDLRNNNIGDIGLQKLKNMKYLKQFMVNQNQITDNGTTHLLEGFPQLQVLWIDNNNISERGALLLYQKSILKICSIVGNQIEKSYHQQIKSLFSRKGLIYI